MGPGLRDPRWLTGGVDAISDTESIELDTDAGERLRVRADRLKPLVGILIDLFDTPAGGGAMRLSPWDAARLGALDELGRWQFHGADSIRALARRLREGGGVRDVPIPRGLTAELRDYQRQGFYWLQFLRENDLSGVLADDMGLGKTVQTLTHILATVRRDLLARRTRPFLLRRRKDEVAKELPPKTTFVRTVELAGAQRDLYEAVRSTMQERVRTAIGEQGLARSHIIMLDALLKLRQVCCDPRLLKRDAAKRVRESSKLDLLLDMVPTLLDEGRRILVFSQFTSMLALIGTALRDKDIGYLMLTGETTDRATPLQAFARGEAGVFLISLKAGGVGLNLTSADTVIHYDPWWNPATETQATDRAHRIGQTKPVFVYKLVAAGSIEEKILSLQAKKAALADLILNDDPGQGAKFSPGDLEALFAPLPSLPSLSASS